MRDNFGFDAAGHPGGLPGGAALRDGSRGWALSESLGAALAWATHFGVTELHVLAEEAAGDLARQAAEFAAPPTVWQVDGRSIAEAMPAPLPAVPDLPAAAEPYRSVFADAGADPVEEDGLLVAEVLGLEVARVGADGELEVGVGKHDREAQKLMHPDRRPIDALVAAVEAVRALRTPDAQPHPMNQLAASRWLRTVVCARPELVGAAALSPAPSTKARPDLRLPTPAAAVGDGVTVVCSTGIDIALVPTAADIRLRHPGRLVLVVPEIDAHPVTLDLAAALRDPAEVVTVPPDWRRLAGSLSPRA